MDLANYTLEWLREDPEFVLYRARRAHEGESVLVLVPTARTPDTTLMKRLEQELSLAAHLDPVWAIQPIATVRHNGRPSLLLEDPGGRPLDALLGDSPDASRLLEIAINLAKSLGALHRRGLIHKDVKPSNVFVTDDGSVRLTGFGFATRLPRERQAPAPPQIIAGTLAYMAPEQTGRMNRSIDTRSDLYSLGVTLYEMLTGHLPFPSTKPMDLIHCHIARQPAPLSERAPQLKGPLESVLLKLLAKNAEDRYQTAAGAEHDLRRCLEQLRAGDPSRPFPLGAADASTTLVIPERLYGRDAALKDMVDAFQDMAGRGTFNCVLLSGYSGVGKSSLVSELHRVLYATHGLFAAGQFDRYKRDIPHATVAEAFRGLLRQILCYSDEELARWRTELLNAVGDCGQLIADLIPELELVIGRQPAAPPLTGLDEHARFRHVLRRFIGAFATADHPLALFLDDLQWLDAATLDVLGRLVTEDQIPYLLLIGAYRSNELAASRDLQRTLETIHASNTALREIELQPLNRSDIELLLADSIHATTESVRELADVLLLKTHGLPLSVVQSLTTLYADGLLYFDIGRGRWQWDGEMLRTRDLGGDVADLTIRRLLRCGAATLRVVKQLACLGNNAPDGTLAAILGVGVDTLDACFSEAIAAGLVYRVVGGFAFSHDGVREAAYALVADPDKPSEHLRIGRLLLAQMNRAELEESLFEVVGHLNRGASLIDAADERHAVAELNLSAGLRAKSAAAHDAALTYLTTGLALLVDTDWDTHHRLLFDFHFHMADCQFMVADTDQAERQFAALTERCRTAEDLVALLDKQVILYSMTGHLDRALDLSLQGLGRLGMQIPVKPDPSLIELEYAEFCRRLAGASIESLVRLPLMQDTHRQNVMTILAGVLAASGPVDLDLQALIILRMANITLEHGLSHEATHAFACLAGNVLGWRLGTYAQAQQFANLAIAMVDERGLDRHARRVFAIISGAIGPWCLPLAQCFDIALRATSSGHEQGGLVYSGYAWSTGLTAALAIGKDLAEVHAFAEDGLAFSRKARFALQIECINATLWLIRALRSTQETAVTARGTVMDEPAYEQYLEGQPSLWHALVRYRIRKLQRHYLFGETEACLDLIRTLEGDTGPLRVFELAEYQFYSTLACAAALHEGPRDDEEELRARLLSGHEQLKVCAERSPGTFENRAALIAAEIARLDGRVLEAEVLYERSIALARDNGFLHIEATACELAAAFYASRGFDVPASAYVRGARGCYLAWGAFGKVHQLDARYPWVRDAGNSPAMTSDPRFQQIDLGAVVEMSQAVSGEIVLERLVERLLATVLECAGAVRGVLLLPGNDGLQWVAEATTNNESTGITLTLSSEMPRDMPRSVVDYVSRTREVVILNDALLPSAHSGDPYFGRAHPRSVMCLPLVKQQSLVGVLYLENNLASHIFTAERLSILRLFASQAAISIENAKLYSEVKAAQEHSRRVNEELRRSFDLIPALAWRASPNGDFEFANQQWHEYTGLTRAEAQGGNWMQAFHPDDLERAKVRWKQLLKAGVAGEFEARMRRFDGDVRRFLVRARPVFDERGHIVNWHGTNTDIETLKQSEQAQEALARATRLTAMGELTVSIVHEISQPLTAISNNAGACVRWLDGDNLDVVRARRAAERIVGDGLRAGQVIAGIRAMAKKAPLEMTAVNLHEIIFEVLALTRNQANLYGIVSRTDLSRDTIMVSAVRVQLQQVVLNLVINAIEAMSLPADGQKLLLVSAVRGQGGHAVVTVADTGPGIDPAGADRVFEAFYTTKSEGLGIGLSVCRSIVEAHGGTLWTAPHTPRGTEFSFTVPIGEDVLQTAAPIADLQATVSG